MKSLTRRPTAPAGSVLACALIVFVTTLLPGTILSQPRGRCAVTELPGHLVLPDGKVYDSGELKVCFEGWHHPGAGRHVIFVHGKKWGYLMSRGGASSELTTDVPLFIFTPRTEHNHVRLLGYAWPDGDGVSIHVLHRPGSRVPPALADVQALLERADDERLVLVAARAQ
jgi:hypothetical protein